MDQIVNGARQKMQRALDVLREDFTTVRTGKASPSLVENIIINAYGGTQPLKVLELATIHIENNSTIVISPFDKSQIAEIEKGISGAKVGLNPIVDREVLRINLPPLTEERRGELVRLIKQKAEAGKVMIRQVRHEGMEDAKKQAEGQNVSEDEILRIEKEIQKLTDEFTQKIDMLANDKEKELMTL
jgi:ribosome recycling factor